MAFKMKGWQAHGKSPMKQGGYWDRFKSWGKEKLQDLSDASVNMSNVAGVDKETRAMWDADLRRQQKQAADQKKRHEDARIKEKEMQGYRDAYMNDPISKQRDNESDSQYKRRMSDVTRHKQMYADKKYNERVAADKAATEEKSLAMSPRTEAQSKETKSVPYAKKKSPYMKNGDKKWKKNPKPDAGDWRKRDAGKIAKGKFQDKLQEVHAPRIKASRAAKNK